MHTHQLASSKALIAVVVAVIHVVMNGIIAWKVRAAVLSDLASVRFLGLGRRVVYHIAPAIALSLIVKNMKQAKPMTGFVDSGHYGNGVSVPDGIA